MMPRISKFLAVVIAGLTLAASSALAHHGDETGGASIGAIMPIAVVVLLGMIGLGIWDWRNRKSKPGRKSRRKPKSRPKSKPKSKRKRR